MVRKFINFGLSWLEGSCDNSIIHLFETGIVTRIENIGNQTDLLGVPGRRLNYRCGVGDSYSSFDFHRLLSLYVEFFYCWMYLNNNVY